MAKRKVLPNSAEDALFYRHRDAYFEFRARELGLTGRKRKHAAVLEYAPYVYMVTKGIRQIRELQSGFESMFSVQGDDHANFNLQSHYDLIRKQHVIETLKIVDNALREEYGTSWSFDYPEVDWAYREPECAKKRPSHLRLVYSRD